jgi:hypothetical protein
MLPDIFPLGPFLVEESGRLLVKEPGSKPGFSFLWRGRRFSVALAERSMAWTAILGKVPSSATGRERREAGLAALRALPQILPSGWTLRLTADHRVQLSAETEMAWPAHVSMLMQPVVRFLLAVGPYLDLIEEAGLS